MKKYLVTLLALTAAFSLNCAFAAETDETAAQAAPPEGSIVHTELYASDLAAMQSFYGDLFGWTFTPMGPEYAMFDDGAGHSGGMTTDPGPMGGEPGRMTTVMYLWCPNIPAKLAEVEAHGGTVGLGVTGIPDYGSFAIIIDPSGNPVGLFSDVQVPVAAN